MTRPIVRVATELAVPGNSFTFNDMAQVELVRNAIRGLEAGIFNSAAQVVEAMGRDDRISGCLETRTRALPALPLHFDPRGDGRQKQAVAKELDADFEDFFSDAALTELHQWGILLGVGLGQLLWQYGESRWRLKLKVWHPRALMFRQDTRSFWVQSIEGPQEVKPGDGQWVLYTPYGVDRGWMHGKVRSLYVPWLMRTWGMRDWARYSEVHGSPIKKVVTPPGVQRDDQERFARDVAAIGAETTILTPRVTGAGAAGDVDRYDLELLEPKSMNWQTFKELLGQADSSIAIAILGQNLSTEVKGGSYAATMAHMQIRNDILQFDAESLGQCIRQQALTWWALHNFGSAELAPMPIWKTKAKTPEERTAVGTALQNLGDGLNAVRLAGVKIDVDKVVEEQEIPVTGPADDLDREALVPPPPAPGTAPGAAPGAAKKPTLPRPTARASATDVDEAPPAAIEGQLYVDRLADDGMRRHISAIAGDIKKVLGLVADAPDFATLRDRLGQLYGDLDDDAEAALLHQGLLMAELAGRYAARSEAGLSVEPDEEGGDDDAAGGSTD
jgi:phage gp29-like protein